MKPLVLTSEQPKLSLHIAPRDRVTIGRGNDCDVRLAVMTVARRQAVLSYAEGTWTLTDPGSPSGTLLNGAWLGAGGTLRAGDRIQLGGITLLVREA